MGRDLGFSCDCGTLTGTLKNVSPSGGTHAVCYCTDCRAAEIYAGQPDPGTSGVGLYQTTPHTVEIQTGLDQLAVFSLSAGGLLRWHAKCCGSVLFNTLRNPKIAFVAVRASIISDRSALGPVRVRAFVPQPNGKQKHEGLARAILGLMRGAGIARITGRWKDTPFFDPATGQPVRRVHGLTAPERDALPRA